MVMAFARIEDNLIEHTELPAREILDAILTRIPSTWVVGIRKIALLDHEYQPRADGKGAVARYVPVAGTKMADVEIYVGNCLQIVPPSLRASCLFWTWVFAGRLLHELFHHVVRGRQRVRRPTARAEERQADRWADRETTRVLWELFPVDLHRNEYERIRTALDQTGSR
jgi:hypothetical protein